MVKDKEAGRILGMLPASAHFYFCRPDIPRGKDALELKKEAGKYGLRGKAYPSVKDAYSAALKNASVEDLIFIGGSTFVVAEVL
jgi:dihydrofolate synthase/folylpolyglutamate synthase